MLKIEFQSLRLAESGVHPTRPLVSLLLLLGDL